MRTLRPLCCPSCFHRPGKLPATVPGTTPLPVERKHLTLLMSKSLSTRSLFTRRPATLFGLTALAALGLAAVCPQAARAQTLIVALQGVAFADGATASGYFDYNPATNTVGPFDFTTTTGTTDGYPGFEYTSANSTDYYNTPYILKVQATGTNDFFTLAYSSITGPGTYSVTPGTPNGSGSFVNSGEGFQGPTNTYRLITGGSVVASAAPEPAQMVGLGFAVLGLGGLFLRAYKRKLV